MPSGAKKRKSSKRPKPKGDTGPELEAGLGEAMEADGVVGDGTPSPREIERESKTLAEKASEAKGIHGESPVERDYEFETPSKDFQIDEAAADRDDSPFQAELDSDIPAEIKAEAPVVVEQKQKPLQEEREPHTMKEPAQNEIEPQVDPALGDYETKVNHFAEDIKSDREMDAVPTDLKPFTDDGLSATDGLDEVHSFGKSATADRRSAYEEGAIENESGLDKSSAEMMETKTDAASGDLAPAVDDVMLISSAKAQSDVHESSIEVKPEAEQEMDGALAQSKPEVVEAQIEEREAATFMDTKSDTEDALTLDRKLETNAIPTITDRESVFDREIAMGDQPNMAAAPVDVKAETDYVRRDIDTSLDGTPPDVGASLNEVQPEADTYPDKLPSQASETNEIDLDENAEKIDAAHNEVPGAEIQAPAATEPEVVVSKEVEPEKGLVGGKTEVNPELPQEAETESTHEDINKDTSWENLSEIKAEARVDAIDEATPEDEACARTRAEECWPVQIKVDRQDLVEEVKAVPDFEPEPDVETSGGIEMEEETVDNEPERAEETSRGIEMEEETVDNEPERAKETSCGMKVDAVPEQAVKTSSGIELEAEPMDTKSEPAAEALVDLEPGETDRSETQSGEPALAQIKPNQSGDQQLEKNEAEEDVEDEQAWGVVGETEEGAATEICDESKEDIDGQHRAVYGGHDEGEDVLASAGSGDGTERASEQEVAAIELPSAAIAESVREDIGDQERTIDVGHDEDGALLGSAGKSAEVEEQELSNELPLADAFTIEESTKEGSPSSFPEQGTEQHYSINHEDRSTAGDKPPSVESEQNLKATMPVESETFSGAPGPQDEPVSPATDEKVASEHELSLESTCGEPEKDVGEEETASSTVAEVGSVLNDFDERASYEQDLLPTDFASIDQDMDTSGSKELDGNSVTAAPEYIGTGLREQVDVESTEAAKQAEAVHSTLPKEASSDEQNSLLQPEEAAQDSGQDNICLPKEELPGNKELKTDGEGGRATSEGDKEAANSILGSALPVFGGDELISKALIYPGNGQQSMSNPEGFGREHRDEGYAQSVTNEADKTEICAIETRELKEADLPKPMGVDANIDANKPLVEPSSTTQEDGNIKDVQVFHQEMMTEASQPVAVPTQDRALELVNLKSTEPQSRGGAAATVEGRRKMVGCCGLLDVLLGKN